MGGHFGVGFWQVYDPAEMPPPDSATTMPIRCPTCDIQVDARILTRLETPANRYVGLDMDDWEHPKTSVLNFVLQCSRCESVALLAWGWAPHKNGKAGRRSRRLLLPIRVEVPFERDEIARKAIPAPIFEDLRQARRCELVGAPYGAGLLYRRACQYICRDKGATKRDLKDQIPELMAKGLITQDVVNQAHHIRIVGNELAHPDIADPQVITDEDVEAAREFIEQLVLTIYVGPARNAVRRAELQRRGVKGA